ncbi:DUF2501 domain-containing protein [Halomonas sp. HP20-15]|uniref:DUF2501 domain-containing protein n=1 Tax=Halomonas sp. HP20-15 TaxID=3085901 RepID=UPI00298209F8|nr:DUF2501 domain-containing protein [Halomonas sp. HP20-15]MDW5378369.1 DUF2501 domain-containing protein [Halomonas sp. HP20-15]
MQLHNARTVLAAAAIGLATLGQAQVASSDSLKEKAGSMASSVAESQGGSGGSMLSALSGGSFSLANMKNAAGVLSFCQENGYSAKASDTAKDKLMNKLGINKDSDDQDYQQGLKGMVQGKDGQSFDLSSVKTKVGEKACGMIADKAMSSFLGG